MSESYCMKPCSECGGCSGCRAGEYSAQCDIAKCCREKWHLSCESCTRCGGCPTRLSRDRMPGMIQEKERKAAQVLQGQKQRVRIMKAWVPMIFWVLIVHNAVDLVLGLLLYLFSVQLPAAVDGVTSAIMVLAVGFGYWKLTEADDGFHFVAVFNCISAAHSILEIFLPDEGILTTILALLMAIFGVMSMRSEFLGYRDALSGIHQELSEKWEKQWTETVYSLAAFGISMLFIFLIPLLGAFVLLCCVFFVLFLQIRKLVYLYQTMEFCREYDRG